MLPPPSSHQYSGISPLSALNDKIHAFWGPIGAWISKVSDGSHIADNAPYPEAQWDNVDDDLLWVIGGHDQTNHPTNLIEQWRPSTGAYTTWIDYTGRFQTIVTGSTSGMTYDNWIAFWAPAEHTLCGVDLLAKKDYCLDVNVPDPVNHLPSATPAVDYVAATPRDSKSSLHYVLMLATPAMGVFEEDEHTRELGQAPDYRWRYDVHRP